MSHRSNLIPSFIKIIEYYNPKPESILDVGCGRLQKYFKRKYGEKYTGSDLTGVECDYKADAHSLPFEDNSYEVVTAWSLLEHVNHPLIVLKEMSRVASKIVLLTTDFTKTDQNTDNSHLYCWTPKVFGQLLKKTGYKTMAKVIDHPKSLLGVIWVDSS